MNLGKKSYSSRWGHERTRYVTNPAKRNRRERALARLEGQLSTLKETINNCKDPIAKEALLQGSKLDISRMEKEVLTLKSRI